jgi:hypothetical protein
VTSKFPAKFERISVGEISMNFQRASIWIFLASLLVGAIGCTSEATRERQQQAEARRKVAQEDEEVQAKESSAEADHAVMLQAQEKLDAVEQKRTNNVYAHSCRKVTMASYALNASNVDTSQCSAEQLKLEQEAEKRQMFDKAFESVRDNSGRNAQ